jgi:hypothetical protein
VIVVSLTNVYDAAGVQTELAVKQTPVTPVKPVPVMVRGNPEATPVPPPVPPLFGVTKVTIGVVPVV